MLDAVKLADLVLLLIDASVGFEMETFEFLSLLGVGCIAYGSFHNKVIALRSVLTELKRFVTLQAVVCISGMQPIAAYSNRLDG